MKHLINSKISVSQDQTAWSTDTLELANTAKDAAYLTSEEKIVIQLMNPGAIKRKVVCPTNCNALCH